MSKVINRKEEMEEVAGGKSFLSIGRECSLLPLSLV
jgi:hypothetical protein